MAVAASVVLVSLAASSCRHKELCYEHPHTVEVTVVFDWENAEGADPASMAMFLFPTDGESESLRYDFANSTGGTVKIPVGTYEAMCVNSDNDDISFSGTEHKETFVMSTQTITIGSKMSDMKVRSVPDTKSGDARVADTPEMLWTDNLDEMTFTKGEQGRVITFYPDTALCSYSVEIRNAENLEYVQGMCGSLTSMAGGMNPYLDEITDEKVTLPFATTLYKDKKEVWSWFYTFGHGLSRRDERTHKLTIYAVMDNGQKLTVPYDVTDQIHYASDPRHVHIVIDKLPLPHVAIDGGWDPDVDEWDEVYIDLPM